MNKKIFTLLAGAFLMFAAVFSVNAQGPLWGKSVLSIGDTVRGKTLELGMNRGYYHLKVDSIVDITSPGTNYFIGYPADTAILYMGKPNAKGETIFFVDSLNGARTNFPTEFSNGINTSKAEESAAGLWCVNITSFANGKEVYFDFHNKQYEEMLEVDIYGYETWNNPADAASHEKKVQFPGGVSGWNFSTTFATMLEAQPLFSYIVADTVAVLCVDNATIGGGDSLYVKIACYQDVKDKKVDGVVYFRLMHAAPFIIDAKDFNTTFGRYLAGTAGQLEFNEDGTNNPFAEKLTAEHINGAGDVGKRISANYPFLTGGKPSTVPLADNYDTLLYTTDMLDSLGYMRFKNASGKYVQVLRKYLTGNAGGHQFLELGFGDWTSTNLVNDTLFLGQKVFRMVYYPSGDSIYINPYQATYLPSWDAQIQNTYTAKNWTDSATLSVFTFYADSAALQNPKAALWGSPIDTLDMVTARLKNGFRAKKSFHEPFRYHHLLYVALQNLTGGNRVTLYTNATTAGIKDHQINTQINFGIYTPCKDDGNKKKTTVAPNVYLIRNTSGQYLQVPLYSATDSAKWVYLEDNEDPRYVPSFHWVVEQKYMSSAVSPVKITNREFEWLKFDNVQLYNEVGPFKLRAQQFDWNIKDINAQKTTTWAEKDNNKYAFIALEKEFKNNSKLGYTWIDPDTSVVNLYAFNYMSGIKKDYYIGWEGDLRAYPNTDTTVFVNYESYFDKMYFRLDTIREDGYGELQPYGFDAKTTTQIADLVTLERQAYRLTYEDPLKYACMHEHCLAPGEEGQYVISKKGIYKDFLGKPVFYLRDYYKVEGEAPYFAMVQRIDSTTTDPAHATERAALEAYLNNISTQAAAVIMDRLDVPYSFNPGIFVVGFQEATSKLLMTLRADDNTTVSTFTLEKDVDPIYRRFNTLKEGDEANDNPDFVQFFTPNRPDEFLYENTGAAEPQFWENFGKKNYLGLISKATFPNADSHSSPTIYVDTAFVNRGTGYIKPQYLLAVRPRIVEPGLGCDQYGEPTIQLDGYVQAYYLINAHDSAYYAPGKENADYLYRTNWKRLVFTPAIHANDYLYILGDADIAGADIYEKLKNGSKQINLKKLHAYATSPGSVIHAIDLSNNKHKDCVFSFRLVERRSDDFLIESETTGRDVVTGPMIAPCEGGWIKNDNGVPVITRSDEVDQMGQAERFNVIKAAKNEATGNDEIAATSTVTVIGNDGAVTILNAAGKSVVINNILGQTVAKAVLTSDNETISAPKGVVIVSVNGENAVKTLVK